MDFFSLFEQYLKKINISLTKEQKELFFQFHKIFIEKNQELNLSRIYNLEEIIRKHYIDSLYLIQILNKNQIELLEPIMDLGSGSGFPGIPLAIATPQKKFILVESRKNRVEYLEFIKKELNLKNIEVIHKTLNYKDIIPVKTVLTRALETMKETAIRTASSLEKNGYLIFYKGPNCLEEISEMNPLFFKKVLEYDYILPKNLKKLEEDQRKIVIFKKLIESKNLLESVNRFYFSVNKNLLDIRTITSKENHFYKFIKKILHSKGIEKYLSTILVGEKIINEFIQKKPESILYFVFSKDLEEKKLIEFYKKIQLKNQNIKYIYMSLELFENLELKEYPSPFLIVRIPNIEKIKKIYKKFLILPIKEPSNLGACIRSSYAFGIKDIILTKESCNPYLLKAIRSSSGYVMDCNFYEVNDLEIFIKEFPYPIYAFHTKGQSILETKITSEIYGYLLGEEGRGISEKILQIDNVIPVTIPTKSPIDSLNVSVSCGIGLFYLENQMNL